MCDLTTRRRFLKVEQIIFEIIFLTLENESHTFLSGFLYFDGTETNQLTSVCGS